jgi:hypothetical protein
LGLEIEPDFLAMGKARREELEADEVRRNYSERLGIG